MALIALALAASISADPPKLVLGRDAGSNLEIGAPASAKVTLSTSVGSVGEAKRDGGVWKARYSPPSVRAPSVALVLAQIEQDGERELSWLAIPLSGSDTMELQTRPGSTVRAEMAGGATVGPVKADAKGLVKLPMVVPPGVDKATLHITDELGNTSQKPLDLEPPPFQRVRIAARSLAASAAQPLEVEVFVVKPDGTPDDRAHVELSASDGGETEVSKRIGHGVYLAEYTPAGKSGTAKLEARAAGQTARLETQIAASKVMLAQPFWQSSLRAQRPWSVSAGLFGGPGLTFAGATSGNVEIEAALRLEVLPIEAIVDAGLGFYGQLSQPAPVPATTETARPRTKFIQLGVRLARQLAKGLDAHLALALGAQSESIEKTLVSGAVVSDSAWTPKFSTALGLNLRVGPGRALAQIQLDLSGADVAGLDASLRGVQALVGYLVTLR